ncbi:GGDEF domain-containing phosphodiesterase [Ancylobacter sp. 6x-1]|uniref:GGDEF domain-containing phosphodiesterase n=1 Tax=Ancylobacter crimeensis TaxID=2579147 RepID=A0ABT0DEP7_9HYPH|nr:GGDEF domain-containing phosphodiesterase [Ancylobacter crimeensis]MCK0198427.1 GGDEF domain-containing phosphodiesterase [Ancylobacter crimeensis]
MPVSTPDDANTPDGFVPLRHDAVTAIVHKLGGAAYRWTLVDDRILWCENASRVLGGEPPRNGASYNKLLGSDTGQYRRAVFNGENRVLAGISTPFETIYRIRPEGRDDAAFWVEDKGILVGGADGSPSEMSGIVRRLGGYEPHAPRRAPELPTVSAEQSDSLLTAGVAVLNRQQLVRLLEQRFVDVAAGGGGFGFLLVNVDNVSRVNEFYGFGIADEIIELVGRRLKDRMSSHVVGRFSSNKFAVVIDDASAAVLTACAQRCLEAVVGQPLMTARGPIAASATVGGLLAPDDAGDVAEVFAHGLDALERAKFVGRGTFHAYVANPEREEHRRANLRVTHDVVSALTERRISLAYQPIADSMTRAISLYECLIRIRGRERQLLNGAAIIPVAEKCGMMRLLDCRVLELALNTLEADAAVRLSVNISPSTIHDSEWLGVLMDRARNRVGERLTIEITETAAIHDLAHTERFVNRLHDIGCKVAMDDFGAGYTSFRNLRRLGIDMLKIDGSYISPLLNSPDDQAFVRTLLSLAAHLGIETVAEWVPNEQTAALLRDWGCTYLQGEAIGLAAPTSPSGALLSS